MHPCISGKTVRLMLGNMKAKMAAALFWSGLLSLPKTKCRQNITAIIRVSTIHVTLERSTVQGGHIAMSTCGSEPQIVQRQHHRTSVMGSWQFKKDFFIMRDYSTPSQGIMGFIHPEGVLMLPEGRRPERSIKTPEGRIKPIILPAAFF